MRSASPSAQSTARRRTTWPRPSSTTRPTRPTDKRWNYLRPVTRREAYLADITYGTNNEFGFDYLRDNMVLDLSQCVQRPLNFAIVDEVDNLLIDEARTPLIIQARRPRIAAKEQEQDLYRQVAALVRGMQRTTLPHEPVTPEEKDEEAQLEGEFDFIAYEKTHNVRPTARGQAELASAFRLSETDLFGGTRKRASATSTTPRTCDSIRFSAIFDQSLKANAWYQRGRDYVRSRPNGRDHRDRG